MRSRSVIRSNQTVRTVFERNTPVSPDFVGGARDISCNDFEQKQRKRLKRASQSRSCRKRKWHVSTRHRAFTTSAAGRLRLRTTSLRPETSDRLAEGRQAIACVVICKGRTHLMIDNGQDVAPADQCDHRARDHQNLYLQQEPSSFIM